MADNSAPATPAPLGGKSALAVGHDYEAYVFSNRRRASTTSSAAAATATAVAASRAGTDAGLPTLFIRSTWREHSPSIAANPSTAAELRV